MTTIRARLAQWTVVGALLLTTASACRQRPSDDVTTEPTALTTRAGGAAGPRPFERCYRAESGDAGSPHAERVADADERIASLRPAFRACYEAALARDRDEQGCVVVHARVEHGRVVSSRVGTVHGLGDATAECVRAVVASSTFDASGTASLVVPLMFLVRGSEPPP